MALFRAALMSVLNDNYKNGIIFRAILTCYDIDMRFQYQ